MAGFPTSCPGFPSSSTEADDTLEHGEAEATVSGATIDEAVLAARQSFERVYGAAALALATKENLGKEEKQ